MKRKLAFIIIVVLFISCLPVVAADDDDYNQNTDEIAAQSSDGTVDEMGNVIKITDTEQIDEILQNSIAFSVGKSKALINNEHVSIEEDRGITPIKMDGVVYLPAKFAAKAFGGGYEYYAKEAISYLKFKNYVIQVQLNSSIYSINGKSYEVKNSAISNEGIVYISVDMIESAMGKHAFYGQCDIVIISDKQLVMDESLESSLINYLVGKMYYERPDRKRITEDLLNTNPNKQHPRLLLDTKKLAQIKELTKTDERYKKWKDKAIITGDGALSQGHAVYNAASILTQSRGVLSLMQALSMAYLFTNDRKYAVKAYEEIVNVSTFPNWNERHFLDTAEMAAAIAIAYDWMYDGFTEEERAFIRDTIKIKAFYPALDAYRQTGPKLPSTQCQWIYADSNWNTVCNGGIGIAALAMADEEDVSDIALECIEGSIISTEHVLKSFAPDGAWMEGVGYWVYMLQYFTRYMSSLEASLGTNYGLMDAPGLKETSYFPIYLTGPKTIFSYGDSGNSKVDVGEWNWFANYFNDNAIAARREIQLGSGGGGFKELIWMNPDLDTEDIKLPKDKYFNGTAEICTMRSAWDDDDALFVGTRAGRHKVNHGHDDIGSYTLDANGVNWAIDSGAGDYSWNEYFGSERYKYYRIRAESHNMVVVNPDDTDEIDMDISTHIKLQTKDRGSYATMDMTKAYAKHDVKNAVRAMGLIDNRSKFIVQDEVETNENGNFYWFMHTKAKVTISEDGKTALLEQDGKKMNLKILSPSDGRFEVGPDMKLSTSPAFPQYESISGYYKIDVNKISIHVNGRKSVDFSVVMTPLKQNESEPDNIPEFSKIADWTIPDGNMPELTSLTIDGKVPDKFKPNQYNYVVPYEEPQDKAPVVDAVSDTYDIKITQAASVPGTAIVDMLENGKSIKKYYINFKVIEQLGIVDGKTKYRIADAVASDTPEAVNIPQNLFDNDLLTKWAAQGDQWVYFDLGETKPVNMISVSWMAAASRVSPFEIQVSDDGKEWTQVYSGKSAGMAADFDYYSFEKAEARYVRLCVHGYNDVAGTWNSIMEVGVYGNKIGN